MADHFERPDTVLLGVGAQEWALWQHSPITAAFLQFIDDQLVVWRELAADLVEGGGFSGPDGTPEDRNIDVVRGKILTLRYLRRITLEDIQRFYGQEPPQQSESDQPDE